MTQKSNLTPSSRPTLPTKLSSQTIIFQNSSNTSQWIHTHLPTRVIISRPTDIHLILVSRFLRMFALGSATLILAFYLALLGFSDSGIGLFFTLTLLGDACVSLALTLGVELAGRRNMLILGSALAVAAGICFTLTTNYWLLLPIAILGVISPSGNEIGPFRAIEEATLAQLSQRKTRSAVFAWYTIGGTTGTALGSLTCGWFVQHLEQRAGWDEMQAYRAVFWVYAAVAAVKLILTLALGEGCEIENDDGDACDHGGRHGRICSEDRESTPTAVADLAVDETETDPLLKGREEFPTALRQDLIMVEQATDREENVTTEHLSHEVEHTTTPITKTRRPILKVKTTKQTWGMLTKLLPLFAVDSFASGMVPFSLIALFIKRKFHTRDGLLGTVMSSTWFLSAASNFFVPACTKRLGYVRTMVYTHLASSVFLLLLPFASVFWLAIFLIAGRASLSSMDQGPRSSFLAAIVGPGERNEVLGLVNVAKTAGLGLGPVITGLMAASGQFGWAFVVSGGLKCLYDGGLYAGFRGVGDESDDVASEHGGGDEERHLGEEERRGAPPTRETI